MPSKKKVLILGKLPPPYMGPSVAFEILINSGLKNNYNLLHLDIKANASLDTLGKWSFKKLFANLGIYKKLSNILCTKKPDLTLIPISQATIGFLKDSVFIIICKLKGTKCLIQLRGSDFKRWVSNSSFLTKMYVRWILGMTEGVLVLGNNLVYLFQDYFADEKIHVVPNGGNYSIPPHQNSHDGLVRIIYLANLQPSKGIEDVISAVKILEQKLPGRFALQVIGAWRKEETKINCLKLVNENRLPVTFLSPVVSKQKFEYLTASDIFVFTPREPEGHPWVIIEAMASGLPIISTSQGAIIESVIDGDNGFIVPDRNPEAIAGKLEQLISETSLRKNMGQRSRELYLENFTEERMVENYIKAFDSIIS